MDADVRIGRRALHAHRPNAGPRSALPAASDWSALRSALAGELVLPGSTSYERVRGPAIANFQHVRPQALVRCRDPADVSETLAFSRRFRLHAAPRSGGHCFAGRSSTEGIVIDVSPMRSVSASNGMATIGAGTRLGELYDLLQEHGLTIPAGCGATVGIAGLTLGGGLGLLGRRHGLTCDHLVAAQVVLADARVLDCDEHRDPELFWALRGAGGGRFCIVTSLAFNTLPTPLATLFHLTWPPTAAEPVVAAWQDWAPFAPDAVTANLRLTAAADGSPPLTVSLFGVVLAGQADAMDLIDPLIVLARADPASATLAHLPYLEAKRSLDGVGGPEEGVADQTGHHFGKSEFFRQPLPPSAIAALTRNLARKQPTGHSRELNFTPLGGAYNRKPPNSTAFVHRHERFLLQHETVVNADPANDETDAARTWVKQSWACVHPWGSGRVYPNFPDTDLAHWAKAYHGSNHQRLLRTKQTYDPHNTFHPYQRP